MEDHDVEKEEDDDVEEENDDVAAAAADDSDGDGEDDDEDDNAEDEVEDEAVEDDDVEREREREREEDDDVEEDNVEEDDDRDGNVAAPWPCAIEMPGSISEEPLFTEIYRKQCRDPDWAQKADTHFVRACAGETHVKISQEPLYQEIQRKNAAPQIEPGTQTHILREPAQSKSMSTCHKRHQKSHFIRKFTGKMPQPRVSTLIKHRPLLWTHCLGNKRDAAIAYNTKFVSKTSPHLPSIKSWPVGPQIRTMRKIASL